MPPRVTVVTTTPAIRTPAVIAISAMSEAYTENEGCLRTPNHAPVAGRGMATKDS